MLATGLKENNTITSLEGFGHTKKINNYLNRNIIHSIRNLTNETVSSIMGLDISTPGEGIAENFINSLNLEYLNDLKREASNYFGNLRENTKEVEHHLLYLIASARFYECEPYVLDRHFKYFLHEALNNGIEMKQICSNFDNLFKNEQARNLIKQDPQILGPLVCYKSEVEGNNMESLISIINNEEFKKSLNENPKEIVNIIKLSKACTLSLLDAAKMIKENTANLSLKELADVHHYSKTSTAQQENNPRGKGCCRVM